LPNSDCATDAFSRAENGTLRKHLLVLTDHGIPFRRVWVYDPVWKPVYDAMSAATQEEAMEPTPHRHLPTLGAGGRSVLNECVKCSFSLAFARAPYGPARLFSRNDLLTVHYDPCAVSHRNVREPSVALMVTKHRFYGSVAAMAAGILTIPVMPQFSCSHIVNFTILQNGPTEHPLIIWLHRSNDAAVCDIVVAPPGC